MTKRGLNLTDDVFAAIEKVLIGGNHLAKIVIERDLPNHTCHPDDVDLSPEDFDIWIAWRSTMLLAGVVKKQALMKREFNNLVRLEARGVMRDNSELSDK